MDILLVIHSFVRWIVVLVAIIAAIKFAIGWARQTQVAKADRGLMSAFSGLVDLQAALGVILLIGSGNFVAPRIEHAITMIVAVIVAHLPMRWKNKTDSNVLRNNLFVIVAVILVVIAGIASLPGNRWFLRGL